MALQRWLMFIGTWNDSRLIQHHVDFYVMVSSSVGFAVWHEVCRVFVSVRSRFSAGKNAPLRIGFRLRLATMSRQRGTPRRASSGRAKPQRDCSAPVPVDYEPHISLQVRVLVEAWENKVLNRELSTGKEGGRINHYWMLKNML